MSVNNLSTEYLKGLQKLDASYPTYYSANTIDRAVYLEEMADRGYRYLQEFYTTDIEMPLLVLNKQDWEKRTQEMPYGGIYSGNNCIHFPADIDHQFSTLVSDIYEKTPTHLKEQLETRIGDENPFIIGFNIFFDGKIVHELTHVFLRSYSIDFESRWFTEFFCDYSNYAFLKRYSVDYPDLLEMQELMPSIAYEGGLPYAEYTKSGDFDRLGFGVGWVNGVWFYCRGMLAILELYKQEGEGFTVDVIKAYSEQDEGLLENLDLTKQMLETWFTEWLTTRQ